RGDPQDRSGLVSHHHLDPLSPIDPAQPPVAGGERHPWVVDIRNEIGWIQCDGIVSPIARIDHRLVRTPASSKRQPPPPDKLRQAHERPPILHRSSPAHRAPGSGSSRHSLLKLATNSAERGASADRGYTAT